MTEPLFKCVDQADWGHPAPYDDYERSPHYPTWRPPLWVLHWQGGGSKIYTKAAARKLALQVRGWHVNGRGWSDIAYNWMGWRGFRRIVIRLRGENSNGANKDSTWWGSRTRTFFFHSGTGVPVPHRRAVESFALCWLEQPAPVTGHGLLPPSPSGVTQDTSCPGPWLREFIHNEGWLDVLGDLGPGRRSWRVPSLKKRLITLGWWHRKASKWYGPRLAEAVRLFQREVGLPVTGRMARADWKRLGEL